MKKISLFFLLVSSVSIAYAGGYRVAIQGQKATGMAHAGVAMNQSVETIFFNPGALTYIDQTELSAGLSLIKAQNNYQNIDLGESASTDSPLGTPIGLYWGKPYGDKSAIGLGIYTPYGSRVEWPTDWAGSHLVNNIELSAIFIQPTYAIEVNDKVSLGVGGILAVGGIEFNRNLSSSSSIIDNGANRADVTLEESGITEFGVNLGALFKINSKLNIGVNYRSEINMESNGKATFNDINPAFASQFPDGDYSAELPLPAELTVGFTYQINDRWLLASDYNFTYWSTYESLDIDFETNTGLLEDSTNPRNYKDAGIIRIGFEYARSEKLTLRGGIYIDESPIRDGYFAPETPRGDQTGLTGGFTYKVKDNFDIDFSAVVLDFEQINSSYDFSSEGPFEGSYTTSTWIIGAGASIQF